MMNDEMMAAAAGGKILDCQAARLPDRCWLCAWWLALAGCDVMAAQ